MKNKKNWKINYKRGFNFNKDTIVEAHTKEEALKLGLIEYRRNYGADGILSDHSIEDVIDFAEEV